jgi:D-alanine-D-alanine ligase-like ATP-grasp enzyme
MSYAHLSAHEPGSRRQTVCWGGAALQPTTYTPIQYRLPDGESFKHEALKWIDMADLKSFPVEDSVLAGRLRDETAKFFVTLNGTGFARCDVRVGSDGTPFWLEINPQCGVYGPSDFGLPPT